MIVAMTVGSVKGAQTLTSKAAYIFHCKRGGRWRYRPSSLQVFGLTGSAYVAIPCVAPIALGGFYSFNGMNFYEYMGKKLHFMFGNKALTYVSTEGEPIIKAFEMEQNGQVKKKAKKNQSEITTSESAVKKQEEFEEMKKKTRNMMFGLAAVFVLAVAGVAAYKAMH